MRIIIALILLVCLSALVVTIPSSASSTLAVSASRAVRSRGSIDVLIEKVHLHRWRGVHRGYYAYGYPHRYYYVPYLCPCRYFYWPFPL
jgi:hypothetical protein